MALDLLNERGTPLDKQQFDWRELVSIPSSKLSDGAFTRVRIILMNGMVNWLLPGDLSVLETTLGFEQVAIEVTVAVAMNEPDEHLAQV
ncbi:hypothetical protein WMF28_29675 [Sorangium sp. So ce590]